MIYETLDMFKKACIKAANNVLLPLGVVLAGSGLKKIDTLTKDVWDRDLVKDGLSVRYMVSTMLRWLYKQKTPNWSISFEV